MCVLVAWAFAFIVYDVGTYTGQYISLLTNAPMAVIHAFETFVLGSDVSAIHEPFHNSWIFMCMFSLSHAFSAFVSSLLLIKIFGFNIHQKLRLYKEKKSRRTPKAETFVLWGVDEVTYSMAESIRNHFGADCKDYRIIVVKTTGGADDDVSTHIGISKVFEIISFKDSELKQLQDLDCLIANTSEADLNALSEYSTFASGQQHDILRKKLHLKSLSKILGNKTGRKIHFLMLSNDEKQNLHDVSILLEDTTLNKFADSLTDDGEPKKVIFYCHARYNGVHRVIEDRQKSSNMEVRVIDSSHINVELLKNNDTVLPVNFVDVEKDGSVSSPFNAMVVGFSEVGRDAVRFIYEFGAFVKTGSDAENAVRSDFHMDVVDDRMEDMAGAFVANAPAIALSLAFIPEMVNPGALIELHNMDCRSVHFYNMLEEKIQNLNYIVIATDDDDLNMTMGVRAFRLATRYRRNLDKLCILVRIKNDEDGHFSQIAKYYNRLWAAQEAVNRTKAKESAKVSGKIKNEEIRKDDDNCSLPIYIFGQDKDVYTYENIIDETVIQRAIRFQEKYEASTYSGYVEPTCESDKMWYKDYRDLMQTEGDFHPSYAGMMRLRRTREQNIANSLHWRTKEILRDKAMSKNEIYNYDWSSLQRYAGQTTYSTVTGVKVDDRIFDFLRVMAQTEHMRWNASHEILGYLYNGEEKNEVRLHHDCLTDWKNLSEEIRSYDNNVVDITLGIIDANRKIQ
ncbi:MAG: hypothetical protein NC097_08000 [Clostridium sp.]|nr:hypothetical protein [Clostridium sp.]